MKTTHPLLLALGLSALAVPSSAWAGPPPSKKIQKLVDRGKSVQAWTRCRDLGEVAQGDDEPLRSACADAHYGFLLEVYSGKESLAEVLDEHWTLWSGTRAATQSREKAATIRLEAVDKSSVEELQAITARYAQTEAAERVVALLWTKVKKVGSSAAMEAFMRDYPNSRVYEEALAMAQSLRFDEAMEAEVSEALRGVLKDYPEHPRRDELEESLLRLVFEEATESADLNPVHAWRNLLTLYPEHPRADEAWTQLMAALDSEVVASVASSGEIHTLPERGLEQAVPSLPYGHLTLTLATYDLPVEPEVQLVLSLMDEEREYTVKEGDAFYLITEQQNVDPDEFAELNKIDKEGSLYPGDVLKIPPPLPTLLQESWGEILQEHGVDEAWAVSPEFTWEEKSEAPSLEHVVTAGETLTDIARRYNRDEDKIISWNDLNPAEPLQEGQRLAIQTGSALHRLQAELPGALCSPDDDNRVFELLVEMGDLSLRYPFRTERSCGTLAGLPEPVSFSIAERELRLGERRAEIIARYPELRWTDASTALLEEHSATLEFSADRLGGLIFSCSSGVECSDLEGGFRGLGEALLEDYKEIDREGNRVRYLKGSVLLEDKRGTYPWTLHLVDQQLLQRNWLVDAQWNVPITRAP